MWSFTFFFFNKRLKRIVMFLVRSVCTQYDEDYEGSQDSIDFQQTGKIRKNCSKLALLDDSYE